MYRSFVCRICRFNNIFQNNLPDVGVLQALNKVAGIVGTSGDDDAGEQHAQPRKRERDTHKGVQIDPRRKADKD